MNDYTTNSETKLLTLYDIGKDSEYLFNKPYMDFDYSRFRVEKVFELFKKQNISKLRFSIISTKYMFYKEQGTNYRYFTDTSISDVFTSIQAIALIFNTVLRLGIKTDFVFPELGEQEINFVPPKNQLQKNSKFSGDKHISFLKSEKEPKNVFIFENAYDSLIVQSYEFLPEIKKTVNSMIHKTGKKNIYLLFEIPIVDGFSPVDVFNVFSFTLVYFISKCISLNKRVTVAFYDKENDLTTVLPL